MRTEWIFIESFTILIETFVVFYFLNSRFVSKNNSRIPLVCAWLILSIIGHIAVFTEMTLRIYDGSIFVVALLFLALFKNGAIRSKILAVSIAGVILLGTTLIGIGIVSNLMNTSISEMQLYQGTSRFLVLIIVKTMQIILLFALSKKGGSPYGIKRTPTLLFFLLSTTVFAAMMVIFIGTDGADAELSSTLIWLSMGLLLVMIITFVLYGIFVREEAVNFALAAKLQRIETETQYVHEIDAMHTNIRKWQHEYRTNVMVLQAYIEKGDNDKALAYIKKLNLNPDDFENILRTGNVVLDAVVSSKLSHASMQNIDVRIHAVYPQDNEIDDMDLCAIVGNLLDNSFEACLKIADDTKRKFISFSLLAKGKNMAIIIRNSYEGDIIKQGDRYLTTKNKRYQGIGIEYVDSIVDKYGGRILRKHDGSIFDTRILMPLKLLRGKKL